LVKPTGGASKRKSPRTPHICGISAAPRSRRNTGSRRSAWNLKHSSEPTARARPDPHAFKLPFQSAFHFKKAISKCHDIAALTS